ncbi:DnaD domain-containing protein [Litchfieldia alkalitelluris]|uniref:DnaD domain-containing protein n=1 Tax=Litchfieldia alkalitelluris TaxID=304268 RepID=UPI001F3F95EE|nr:DnaD domain protein [Litchfieldia alkalitelluris]
MAKYRMVRTDFWKNPMVSEELTPEDRYFFLYLLTNHHTTQIGIYKITKKEMAFDMGYSIETVIALMDRMIHHHKLIRYNPQTREIAIKNWGKYNLHKGGKPVMDCIISELKDVQDTSLISYVANQIAKEDIQAIYKSFYEMGKEVVELNEEEYDEYYDDTFTTRSTIRGQKEKEKENKKQQQKALYPNIDYNPKEEMPVQSMNQDDAQEIVEFWDQNGFGYSNVNAKEQLLSWLENSRFLNPKDVMIKAMQIACSNNKKKLNYVVGILKNWENESLLTVEEINYAHGNKKPISDQGKPVEFIPEEFVLDITAGEDW